MAPQALPPNKHRWLERTQGWWRLPVPLGPMATTDSRHACHQAKRFLGAAGWRILRIVSCACPVLPAAAEHCWRARLRRPKRRTAAARSQAGVSRSEKVPPLGRRNESDNLKFQGRATLCARRTLAALAAAARTVWLSDAVEAGMLPRGAQRPSLPLLATRLFDKPNAT